MPTSPQKALNLLSRIQRDTDDMMGRNGPHSPSNAVLKNKRSYNNASYHGSEKQLTKGLQANSKTLHSAVEKVFQQTPQKKLDFDDTGDDQKTHNKRRRAFRAEPATPELNDNRKIRFATQTSSPHANINTSKNLSAAAAVASSQQQNNINNIISTTNQACSTTTSSHQDQNIKSRSITAVSSLTITPAKMKTLNEDAPETFDMIDDEHMVETYRTRDDVVDDHLAVVDGKRMMNRMGGRERVADHHYNLDDPRHQEGSYPFVGTVGENEALLRGQRLERQRILGSDVLPPKRRRRFSPRDDEGIVKRAQMRELCLMMLFTTVTIVSGCLILWTEQAKLLNQAHSSYYLQGIFALTWGNVMVLLMAHRFVVLASFGYSGFGCLSRGAYIGEMIGATFLTVWPVVGHILGRGYFGLETPHRNWFFSHAMLSFAMGFFAVIVLMQKCEVESHFRIIGVTLLSQALALGMSRTLDLRAQVKYEAQFLHDFNIYAVYAGFSFFCVAWITELLPVRGIRKMSFATEVGEIKW